MRREERLDDQELGLREALETQQAKMWTALPALVVDVDLDAQTLSAQPAIQAVVRDKDNNTSNITLPILINVPIIFPRGGGFALTLPVQADDEVLIVFSSRCIDSWWQSGGVGVQVEQRLHDLSDGFAILAPTSQPKKLTGVSSDSVQIRNESGDSFIEIDSTGKIRLISTSSVEINSPEILLQGPTSVTGGLKIDGIIFANHVHGGIVPGSGFTLPPS
jgi:hypothetical protein